MVQNLSLLVGWVVVVAVITVCMGLAAFSSESPGAPWIWDVGFVVGALLFAALFGRLLMAKAAANIRR